MLPKELSLILRKYKNKVFVYAWEYFTKRIHDELAYSVLEESPFFYVEINFNIVYRELPSIDDRLKFWRVFFELLSTQKRGCDLCGFLSENNGIAFLFVDSVMDTNEINPVWNRFCNEVEAQTFFDMRKWHGIIYAEYPPKEFFAKK
jgi:AAA+ ATPase superfamily predicted ATPase